MPRLLMLAAFDAAALFETYPPVFRDDNKQLVRNLACPAGTRHHGVVDVTRWMPDDLPADLPARDPELVVRDGVLDYQPDDPCEGRAAFSWQLNFANQDLFCAYGGPAFAQDEIQVAEHPILGSVREWLLASFAATQVSPTKKHPHPHNGFALSPTTREGAMPTPILIRNVARHCSIATDADLDAGRPRGLYGNQFRRAKADVIRAALTRIDPPTISNILAIEAPPGGTGLYTRADVDLVLSTAYTGFGAAVLDTQTAAKNAAHGATPEPLATVIHTGHWGTGVYGGDRVVMALLQLIAARLAGVDRVVFHAFDDAGVSDVERARATLARLAPPGMRTPIDAVTDAIVAMGFRWGSGDGN